MSAEAGQPPEARRDTSGTIGVARDLRRAAWLCTATVTWNLLIGTAAVVTAINTGSLTLIGFGVNAVVDSSVSVILVWKFRAHSKGEIERAERAEHVALRVAAFAFAVIAVYLAVEAIAALATGAKSEVTAFAVAESLAALLVLPFLALSKYRLATRIESRALRADSLLTLSGVVLAAIALVSLLAQSLLGATWADPVGALLVSALLAHQSYDALRSARD